MLAVREGYRDQRIGARLKLAQREDALRRGIERMEWTFDPLEIKNAFLNIHKLGAVVRRYEGELLWCILISTAGRIADGPAGGGVVDWIRRGWGSHSGFTSAAPQEENWEQIVVPAAIYAWKADDRHRHGAREVQAENRRRFQQAFAEGWPWWPLPATRKEMGRSIWAAGVSPQIGFTTQ
jgi:hypothetical protein